MKSLSKCCNAKMIIKFDEETELHRFICSECLRSPLSNIGIDKNIKA